MGTQCPFILWQETRGSSRFSIRERGFLIFEGKVGIPLKLKQGNQPSSRDEVMIMVFFLHCGGKLGVLLELQRVSWGSLLSCIKGVKPPFEFREGTQNWSLGYAAEMDLI